MKRKALRQRLTNVDEAIEEGTLNETLNVSFRPVDAVNAIRSTPRPPVRQSVCYNCQEVGHFKRNCPKLVQEREVYCHGCRRPGHTAARCPEAPPKPITCFACGGVGHIARSCPYVTVQNQLKRTPSTGMVNPHGGLVNPYGGKRFKAERAWQIEEETINFLNGGKSVDCLIGGVKLTMLLDTGCTSNIVDTTGYEILRLQKAALEFSEDVDKKFVPFGSTEPLKTMGTFRSSLQVGDKRIDAKFYVVAIKARCLLGLESAQEIGMFKLGDESVSQQ